jgi:hypothetical protein
VSVKRFYLNNLGALQTWELHKLAEKYIDEERDFPKIVDFYMRRSRKYSANNNREILLDVLENSVRSTPPVLLGTYCSEGITSTILPTT